MQSKKKLVIAGLVLLIFIEVIWIEKLTMWVSNFLKNNTLESNIALLRYPFALLAEKLPVLYGYFPNFIVGFAHLLLCVLCAQVYFSWQKVKTFNILIISYLIFICIAIALIYAYIAQPKFFKVWNDFLELFFSPFPLIAIFFIFWLMAQNKR